MDPAQPGIAEQPLERPESLEMLERTQREHARRAGIPVDRISEVSLEISPLMFR
jgi:hypothetical protein